MDKKEDTIVRFRVKEALKGKEYDLEKLVAFFDVKRRQTVTDIVNGKKEPSLKNLKKLSEFFNTEIHEFVVLKEDFEHIYNDKNEWKGILPKCKKE